MKIVTVIGARPQFVKAAVVSRAIAKYNKMSAGKGKLKEIIAHTGQHYDKNMSDVFFDEMHIPKPDHYLNVNGLSHGAMTGQMLEKIESVLLAESPDYVLVYGDTNSTLAGALAAAKLHIPVAHVESGLRSFNRRMPEEINRVMTDHVSTLLFCPTQHAVENLKTEGVRDNAFQSVIYTGDVMLDAALFYKKSMKKPNIALPDHFVLATVHRAENTEDCERLESIFDALHTISKDQQIILPIHPRTKRVIRAHNISICNDHIKLIEPVSYYEMLYLLEHCDLVMTDSGGLQKEAYFFKKCCITLRNETEWVELIEHHVNCTTGADYKNIITAYRHMKTQIVITEDLYGDGCAGERIVQALIGKKSDDNA